MTANDALAAAAREAIALGEQIAEAYHEAAGRNPGVGLAVELPYVVDSQGRKPVGLGFDLPPDVPALRRPERPPTLTPDYASEAVGGLLHHTTQPGTPSGLDGVAWPSGQTKVSSVRASSVVHVGASQAQQSWPRRLAATIKRALGL